MAYDSLVYLPKYRSVAYLSDILRSHIGREGVSPSADSDISIGKGEPDSASDYINRKGDVLVYRGPKKTLSTVREILALVDTPIDEVYVAGYVFEVSTNERNGSGFALAAKLLSSNLNIRIGTEQGLENFIKINTGSLDALYELFRTDSRFHVVSSPKLRVKSGSKASFSVGSEVPVLGNVTYSGDRPVQSVEYRQSGVIFDVLPDVRQSTIDMVIRQQLSNFVKTTTGVNNSPTLIKRDVSTSVSVQDGDIIVLGGVAEVKDTESGAGLSFLPRFMSTTSKEKSNTDIIVILQAYKIARQ